MSCWDKVGGFSEDFPLNYNDVDYCLKVREQGCRTVYVPEVELYHYESVSREAARGVKPGELEHFQSEMAGALLPRPLLQSEFTDGPPLLLPRLTTRTFTYTQFVE